MKFKAKVIKGRQIGSKFGVATANLEWNEALKLNLNEGVYLTQVSFGKRKFDGLLHVGKLKTLDQGFSVEVHIFDFDEDVYGKSITVEILKFVRQTKKFENIDLLFKQIKKDIVRAKKYFLRQNIYKQWRLLTAAEKEHLSCAASCKISTFPAFKAASDILIYAPQVDREIDFTQNLMRKFPEKKFYFPKVQGKELSFYQVESFDCLKEGAFGVLEPIEEKNAWVRSGSFFVLVPAVAASEDGLRLGKGGGFYDKFLRKIKEQGRVSSLCILPEFAVLEEIPVEAHDVKVDFVFWV